MLNIILERFAAYHDAMNGKLYIDGMHVCDTLEHRSSSLPEGRYRLKQQDKQLLIGTKKDHRQPRLKASNGPYGLKDGSVSVGECHHIGFLIKCDEHLLPLCDRIRKTEKRGGEVWLDIKTNLMIER